MVFGERLAAGRRGARDGQRGRLQLALDADANDTQRQADEEDDGEAQGGPAKAQPSPPMAAILG